jgi:hypothetical protein
MLRRWWAEFIDAHEMAATGFLCDKPDSTTCKCNDPSCPTEKCLANTLEKCVVSSQILSQTSR